MELSEQSLAALTEKGIPEYMHGGIMRWIENRIPPGGFLTAVIDNDLKEACGKADDVNKHLLFNYINWLYSHAPAEIWGFPGATQKWCERESNET